MEFASNHSRLGAVALALAFAGCAGTPFARLNPVLRREWEADEKYGPTIHTKTKELAQVRSAAHDYSTQQQEELSQQLAQLYQNQTHTVLRRQYINTLGEFHTATAEATLRTALSDSNAQVRIAAIEAWRKRSGAEAAGLIAGVLGSDTDLDVRMAAARALGDFPNEPAAVQGLGVALEDANPAMQYRAVQSLKDATGKNFGDSIPEWREYVKSGGTKQSPPPTFAQQLRRLFF